MAKRGRHSFIKYQKELKRKKKAEEKLAKRLGKKNKATEYGMDEFEVEENDVGYFKAEDEDNSQ